MAATFLDGISLANFRGIGSPLFIGPFQDINFFIGPNNVGKSTVLLFLANYLRVTKRGAEAWARTFDPVDVRLGKNSSEVKFLLGVKSKSFTEKTLELTKDNHKEEIGLLRASLTNKNCGLIWLEPDTTQRSLKLIFDDSDIKALSEYQWRRLWQTVTGMQGGGLDSWTTGALQRIAQQVSPAYPEVHLIPAIREVSEKGADFTDYSGKGLIDKLAELQNPPHDQRHLRTKFDDINTFLRTVTECNNATIEIPHDRRYMLVHMEDKVLPLSSLGTGIHEVVMIASFCTLLEHQIVCVEEPEIHLHPLLQRKLIRYLKSNTSNQYFIATHSASIIDAVPASIFSVENVSGESSIKLRVTPTERHEICKMLGYRASDLLQTNAIIWVEGPSDRIYLNHWIRAVDSNLVEGVDYSIMFYGGRLLSHLSVNDPEINDFISLRKLNRNVAVVIDSDKTGPRKPINSTKERVARELGETFSWVTTGREIENYVPAALMEKVFSTEYSKFDRFVGTGRFDHRLPFFEKDTGKQITKIDKVKIANRVAAEPADLSELDLGRKVRSLVGFIKEAGHAA